MAKKNFQGPSGLISVTYIGREQMLTGWKSIAGFCGVSTQTAKKWYKNKGMPILRGPNNMPISFATLIREWMITYQKIRQQIEGAVRDQKS